MTEGKPLTYRHLAAKLRKLRRGRAELDRQIDAMIQLLPERPEDFDAVAGEWEPIQKALIKAAEVVLQGAGHVNVPDRCMGFTVTEHPLSPRKASTTKTRP